VNLAYDSHEVSSLRIGYFDADGRTDVMTAFC